MSMTPDEQGATPKQEANSQNQQNDPTTQDGAKPEGGEELGEAGLKALREEREARKTLEKQISGMKSENEQLKSELSIFRRRDAVENALSTALKAHKDAGLDVSIELDKAKALLMRFPESDIPDAAKELVSAALPNSGRRKSPLQGQPVVSGDSIDSNSLDFATLSKLNQVGGKQAVEAAMASKKK